MPQPFSNVGSRAASDSDEESSSSTTTTNIGPPTQPTTDIEPHPNPHDGYWISGKLRRYPLQRQKSLFESPQQLFDHLDTVDPQTVGRLEKYIPTLCDQSPEFCKSYLKLVSEEDYFEQHDRRKPLPPLQLRPTKEAEKRSKTRGKPHRTVNAQIAEAFIKYIEGDGDPNHKAVFYHDEDLTNTYIVSGQTLDGKHDDAHDPDRVLEATTFFRCSIFTVDKTDECQPPKIPTCPLRQQNIPHYLQRIISDARIANAKLENPAYMDLFRIEVLLDLFSRCVALTEKKRQKPNNTHLGVYTVSADQRHWFHQIPMPRRFRGSYTLDLRCLRKRTGRGRRTNTHIYHPRTWPMGASPAPGIAQAITWAALLSNLEVDFDRRKNLGIDWPEHQKFDTYLPWLPLKCGGGVFVLIDNIFIITTDKTFAYAWQNRIHEVTREFNIQLKELQPGETVITTLITPENLHESEFSGITFNWFGRKPRNVVDKVSELEECYLQNASQDARTQQTSYKTTYRELASTIGQCLWGYRVRSIPTYSNTKYQSILKFTFPKGTETWDSYVTFTGDNLQALASMYHECRTPNNFTPHDPPLKEIKSYAIMATDAAYKNGTASRGFCYFVKQSMSSPASELCKVEVKPEELDTHIALEELKAVRDALKHLQQRKDVAFPDLILLAIDSTHAKGMITNGIARSDTGTALLKEIYEILGTSRLHLSFVASELNPADALTREDKSWNFKLWYDLVVRLDGLAQVATFEMKKFGQHIMTEGGKRRKKK